MHVPTSRISAFSPSDLAHYFDATDLRLNATAREIRRMCERAVEDGCCCVMIYPSDVRIAREVVNGTRVRVGTVIGFPHGRCSTQAKEAELVQAAALGAQEADIVMNYASLLSGDKSTPAAEIQRLVGTARRLGMLTKIIIETCYLDESMLLSALRICEDAEADFVKTSTGFGNGGARPEFVRFIASHRRTPIKVKASGGIRSVADALAMIEAGAKRIGSSNTAAILSEYREEFAHLGAQHPPVPPPGPTRL
jgi:deoxyribose-phosphate aldolase